MFKLHQWKNKLGRLLIRAGERFVATTPSAPAQTAATSATFSSPSLPPEHWLQLVRERAPQLLEKSQHPAVVNYRATTSSAPSALNTSPNAINASKDTAKDTAKTEKRLPPRKRALSWVRFMVPKRYQHSPNSENPLTPILPPVKTFTQNTQPAPTPKSSSEAKPSQSSIPGSEVSPNAPKNKINTAPVQNTSVHRSEKKPAAMPSTTSEQQRPERGAARVSALIPKKPQAPSSRPAARVDPPAERSKSTAIAPQAIVPANSLPLNPVGLVIKPTVSTTAAATQPAVTPNKPDNASPSFAPVKPKSPRSIFAWNKPRFNAITQAPKVGANITPYRAVNSTLAQPGIHASHRKAAAPDAALTAQAVWPVLSADTPQTNSGWPQLPSEQTGPSLQAQTSVPVTTAPVNTRQLREQQGQLWNG